MARRPGSWGLLVVTACTVAFFHPLIYGFTFSTVAGHQKSVFPWRAYENPYVDYPQSDQASLSYPWQAFLTRSIRSGDPPLWNPLSFAGQPFLGNGTSGVFYPPRLLAALLFSPSGAHDFLSVLHVFGAGIAMFLLCRQLRLGTAGSLLGATSWMFASFNMAWLHLEVVAPVTLFVPLSLLLVRRAVEAPGIGHVVGAAVALGCTLVSGHLLFMAIVWAVAVAYGLASLLHVAVRARRGPGGRGAAWSLGRLAAVTLGGPVLFAHVLLPTFLSIRASNRGPLPYENVHRAVRSEPRVLLNVVRPPPLPPTEHTMNRQMAFAGTAAGLLALLGALRRGPAAALGRTMAAGVLLLALDTPLLRLAYALVPGFSLFRPLGRLFFLLNFAVALLGAAGLDSLLAGARNLRRRWSGTPGRARLRGPWLAGAVEYGIVPAIVAVNTVQLLGYARAVNPPFHPRTPELLLPRTPLIEAAMRHVRRGEGRLLPLREAKVEGRWFPPALYGSHHMVFGLPSLGGYDSAVPERSLHVSLVVAGAPVEQVLYNPGVGAYVSEYTVDRVRFELLPRVGVTTVIGPPGIRHSPHWARTASVRLTREYAEAEGELYGIQDAPGRVWLVSRTVLVDTPGDALMRLADPAHDVRREVILVRGEAYSAPGVAYEAATPGEARLRSSTNNRLVVHVNSSAGGWLVVADTWDRGWRATVDDRPVPILQANYAYRAVQVPRGEHLVEMRYVPVGLVPGLACSAVAWLTAAAALAVTCRRKRRGGAPPPQKEFPRTGAPRSG